MVRRILLVDDDPMVRGLGERMINALGFTCDAVSDGIAALARLGAADGHYHAVVTDLMMPEMNGSQLLEALDEHYPTLPVVIASGDTVAADTLRGRRRPGRSVLIKPYRLHELRDSLHTAIGSHGTGDGDHRPLGSEELPA
jgi:CheY-like chemotaxis protein